MNAKILKPLRGNTKFAPLKFVGGQKMRKCWM